MSQVLAAERGTAPARSAAAPRRVRRALAVGVAVALLFLGWVPTLRAVGSALVSEDPLESADVLVVSSASAVGDAFEAATLYREGYAREILLPGATLERHVDDLHGLGIPYLPQTELVRAVLEHSGVPSTAIRTLPDRVDGTETEIAATAAFAAERRPHSLLFVIARSHTARAGWLLRHALPGEIKVIVHSPRDDIFDTASWWHSR